MGVGVRDVHGRVVWWFEILVWRRMVVWFVGGPVAWVGLAELGVEWAGLLGGTWGHQ